MDLRKSLTLLSAFLLILIGSCMGWGDEKVKLKDVQVLTLKQGEMTAGRRSSPVPQLKCVGGSANCEFMPRVVQCYNRGSDGYDIQWECKTDMDNDYRFGDISVSCEGYDYPNDPYVLKGSCGLEYTIEFTKEGRKRSDHHHYGKDQSREYGWNPNIMKPGKNKSDFLTNLLCGGVVVVIVYAIYKTCIAPSARTANQRSTTNDDYGGGPNSSPPPPGFRSNYSSGDSGFNSGFGGDSCRGSASGASHSTGSGGSWARNTGGFWTGAATGGLLGYMFGSRNNDYNTTGGATYRARPSTSWGSSSSWGSSGSSSWGGGSSSGGGGGGSRSASGFGGTSRR